MLLLGISDYETNNKYDEAMSNLKSSSENGNSFFACLFNMFNGKQSNIGSLLLTAASHFRKLGDEGDVSALFIYGLMLRNGFGVEQDLSLSHICFKNAAE